MTNTEVTQAMQEQLARAVGFERFRTHENFRAWKHPDASTDWMFSLPDFLSLDVLFKYVIEPRNLLLILRRTSKGYSVEIWPREIPKAYWTDKAEAETAGTALFLACHALLCPKEESPYPIKQHDLDIDHVKKMWESGEGVMQDQKKEADDDRG